MNFKLIFWGLFLLLLYPSAYAQNSKALSLLGKSPTASQAELVQTLTARLEESFERAVQATQNYPKICNWGLPSKKFVSDKITPPGYVLAHIPTQELYPYAPFLTEETLPAYFVIKNNLEIAKWLPILEKRRQTILANADLLHQNATPITHPPHEDIMWLSKQVTEQTSYLFLGETDHYSLNSSITVAHLLHELHIQQPQRKIVLFTEFLFEGQKWEEISFTDSVFHTDYVPIWNSIAQNEISIIGLEPHFVYQYEPELQVIPANQEASQQIVWSSLEGVLRRNARWKKTLEQYRLQDPNALFVIYAGRAHLDYTAPGSLATSFSNENILNVVLDLSSDGKPSLHGFFDTALPNMFQNRVLQFQDKKLAHIAGFDIRLIIEK